MRLDRRASAVAVIVGGAMALGACAVAPPAPAPRELTVMMHPLQRTRIGDDLAAAIETALPDATVRIGTSELGIDLLAAVQEGAADFAFVYADGAYLAYTGELASRPYDRLRGVATLNTNPIHLFVSSRSPVMDIVQLRGRRVSLGQAGSSTAHTAQIMLEALGVDVTPHFAAFGDAVDRLAAGELDAIFAVGSYPSVPFRRAKESGARLVSLSQAAVDRIHAEYPFLRAVVIPAGMYDNDPVLTVGADRLLICREDLEADTVYRVTRAFLEALPHLSVREIPLQQMNVELAGATLIPLHTGAARYYREQE
jgi:uncharacterized protein